MKPITLNVIAKQFVTLSLAAGALALGLSFSVAQAAMAILDAPRGVHSGARITPVTHMTEQCREQRRACLTACGSHENPNAQENCKQNCDREHQRCRLH